jgi:hypothetical protein
MRPGNSSDAQSYPSGRDWRLLLSLSFVVLAAGLAVVKWLGQGPAHLQSGHISTFYVAVLAYEYAALPITALISLAWLLLVMTWLWRLRQPVHWQTAVVPIAVTTAALLWAAVSTLPQLFVGYEHLKTATVGGEDYHLGVRTALDGDLYFVVSRCPHRQLRCDAYGVAAVDATEWSDLSEVELAGDTSQGLVIQTVSRTIPVILTPR